MKKHIYRISLFLNISFACFLLIKGTSYYVENNIKMPEVKEEYKKREISAKEKKSTQNENSTMSELKTQKVSAKTNVLTCDSIYLINQYDYTTKLMQTLEVKLPEQYIGKDRSQMIDIISQYETNPSLEDRKKGFETINLTSFSPELMIVTKYYRSANTESDYYLQVEDNYITVYLSDLRTVYLYTGIYMPDLPQNIQQEILDKKYIATKEELYNFLESYSS